MALPKPRVVAYKGMISVLFFKRYASGQLVKDSFKLMKIKAALLCPLHIFLKLRSGDNR